MNCRLEQWVLNGTMGSMRAQARNNIGDGTQVAARKRRQVATRKKHSLALGRNKRRSRDSLKRRQVAARKKELALDRTKVSCVWFNA